MTENTIINTNCFDVFPKIGDESIDLIVTDPPYGIKYKDWDKIDFIPFTEQWVQECFRVLKPTGTLWSFMGYQNIFDFVPILNENGMVHLENWVVWARQKGRGATKHLKSQREDIFHVTKSKNFTWNNIKILRDAVVAYVKDGKPRGWFINEDGRRVRWTGLGNVWVFTAPFWNSKTDIPVHPAQKPIAMIERLIQLSSNEGDFILDPFAGSCVVDKACKNLCRNSICIEKEEKYINV